MAENNQSMHQYEPLRVPSNWNTDEKRFVMQLTEIFDDIYRRFGRLRFEDLGKAMKQRITDTEGNVTEIEQTTEGITLAVNNNRLEFTSSGLIIKNAAGDVVFSQDSATGNLELVGVLRALGGVIGGFTITQNTLQNGSSIVLSSDGYVKLGDLTITDDPDFGPIIRTTGGMKFRVGNAEYLVLGEGAVSALFPLRALNGLYIDPADTTGAAPNAHIDPATGRIRRSTSGGGGGGNISASLAGVDGQYNVNQTIALIGSASGGTAPYTYAFAVSRNGGAYETISGTGSTRNYTPAQAGTYRFRLVVSDASNSDTVYSNYVSVNDPPTSMTAYVMASHSNISSPTSVTWAAGADGGSGEYAFSITLYKDGSFFDSYAGSVLVKTLTSPGTYSASVQVTDLNTLETKNATGGYVAYASPVQYAKTTGTNVNVRSGPGTGYGVVTQIAASGTQVQITGALSNGWYPVYWSGHSGYIIADYLQLI